MKLFKELLTSKWFGILALWQSLIYTLRFSSRRNGACRMREAIDRTASLQLKWDRKGVSNPAHTQFSICQSQAVGGFCIHRKDCVWLRFWSGLISLLYGKKLLISHFLAAQGKWEVGSTRSPKPWSLLKKKKKIITFIQQPNLHCLLFFDASCKIGNKCTQGQVLKERKLTAWEQLERYLLLLPCCC